MISFTQCKQIARNGDLRVSVQLLLDQPAWITQHLDIANIQAVNQGGCASGAYMPAVTYYTAAQTMAEYGDDVLQYIEEELGELPAPYDGFSWRGLACFYLSYAVELWCGQFEDLLDSVDWD